MEVSSAIKCGVPGKLRIRILEIHMNIFLLTWLDISSSPFKSGYDAAKEYAKALNCNQFATTIKQLTLSNVDPKTTRLVGVDPGENNMKAMGGINAGTLDKQIGRLQGNARNCYVVSTNKSHHLSWALSKQAFQKHHKKGNPKVVINMDQHTDCGSSTGALGADNEIQCGNWGQYHLKYHDDSTGQDDRYYVVLGCEGQNASGIFWDKTKGAGNEKGSDDTVLKKMGEELKGKNCDVYITIDNDVFSTQITHYKAGVLRGKVVWGLLDKALKTMRTLNVVGGDVTGLPKKGGGSQAEMAKKITSDGMKKITNQF
jgi:hypothetical protein